jgi:hypothetical protein
VPDLRLAHATFEDLARDHEENLRKGRAFVVGAAELAERERCSLVVVHPASGATLSLEAEVVWVKREAPGAGVGVQLVGFDDEARRALAEFVASSPPAPEPEETHSPGAPRNLHERVRALSLAERITVARQGSLPERVVLERTFGASVWEGLLLNPQITPPEVAKIAKNGTLPRPLVQVIVANAAWVAVPEIQRALLGNPRVTGAALERVIRAVPKAELTRVATLTAYRAEVRTLATKALRAKP